MDVSETDGAVVCAGLEQIRHAERLRTSRALHDQIGPSLCSAGLMVGLLRSNPGDIPPMAQDMLETIQDALETTVDAVRALSYGADPALTQRCGLRGALEFLSRAYKTELDLQAGLPPWPPAQAGTACRILQDALLVLPAGDAAPRLESTPSRLSLAGADALPAQAHAALAALASASGLRLDWPGAGAAACLTLQTEEMS